MSVEDVIIREGRVTGFVINWLSVKMSCLPVDPLSIAARYVIDTTGHDAEVVRVLERRLILD